MNARMVHRGPDDEGRYVDEASGCALGVRRLSIIDVEGGHQPVSNEEGTIWAVLNGEIYNHQELRAMLGGRGHRFRSDADTETIPHLYEEYGADFVTVLRGMFAIAVWDEQRQRLVLVRDRAGEKPLLYTRVPSGLVFASELKALFAHPEVGRELNPLAVRQYLTLQYVPGPQTIVDGIEKLPPGHRAVMEGGTLSVDRYWDVVPGTSEHCHSREGAARELRALLEDAVASQMDADVPVGALLSGGVDSAGIVALMRKAAGGGRVRTFTVGFSDPAFDERAPARVVADHCGTVHRELLVDPPSFSDLEDLVWHLDEPVADQAALPTFLIARVASEHVTVVLTGEGSDELFAGYPRYRWFMLAQAARHLPPRVARDLGRLAEAAGDGTLGRQVDLMLMPRSPLERHLVWTQVFEEDDLNRVLTDEYAGAAHEETVRHLARLVERWSARPPVEQAMFLDLKTWLVDDILTKADRMSMAASIEGRAPYLDHRVIEFVTCLPPQVRVGSRVTKPLLREALAGLLPAEALQRRKHAFQVPVEQWLASGLANPLRELLLAPDAATATVLRRSEVERLLAATGREAARRVWTLGLLELWMRRVLSVPAGAAGALAGA